jgi:pseudouridylate synthase
MVSVPPYIRILPDVAAALAGRGAVVALESSVLAQGLPVPANREAAARMVAAVERAGAVAAITAVAAGRATLGLEPAELERFLAREGVAKVSARDLAATVVARGDGATTVAAAIALAHRAGVEVFATGGIGGVHRGQPLDESADLLELARTPMVVVCSGAKSILDLAATWERLDTLGIPVVGYRTNEFPGFFYAETGIPIAIRAETAGEIAAIYRAHRALGRPQSLIVTQPPPSEGTLSRDAVETAVASAHQEAVERGVRGSTVTPYLLAALTRLTNGSSLQVNLSLLEANARLAAEIAIALLSAPAE